MMALEQLTQLVNAGVVAVSKHGGGYRVTGAVKDLLVKEELEGLGAEYRGDEFGYYVSNNEVKRELEGLAGKSRANAAALKVRKKRVKIDGVKEFDRQRARMLRENGRALKDVYRGAILDVRRQLDAIAALTDAEQAALAYRRGELNAMLEQLSAGLADAGRQAENLATAQLEKAAEVGGNVTKWQLDGITGKGIARFLGMDYAALAVHGKYDLIAWDSIADKKAALKKLRQEIGRGLLMGEHPSKIAERLEGTFNQWRNRAVVIANTETSRIMSQAAQETYAAARDQYGLKVKNEWVATLDGSTRKSHRDLDGEVREIGKPFKPGVYRPGQGSAAEAINCRCCLSPVVDGFEPDADVRRDNITGENVPYARYHEWAKAHGIPDD